MLLAHLLGCAANEADTYDAANRYYYTYEDEPAPSLGARPAPSVDQRWAAVSTSAGKRPITGDAYYQPHQQGAQTPAAARAALGGRDPYGFDPLKVGDKVANGDSYEALEDRHSDSYDPEVVLNSLSNAAYPPSPPDGMRPPAYLPAEYWTSGHEIFTTAFGGDALHTALQIKGVSWFGLEGSPCEVGGLGEMSIEQGAAFLRKNAFNAVRIPLAADAVVANGGCMPTVLTDDALEQSTGRVGGRLGEVSVSKTSVKPAYRDARARYAKLNPRFVGESYLGMLASFIKVLGEHGLLVMLDVHTLTAGAWPDDGKVGNDGRLLLRQAWRRLATTFADPDEFWNVFAADLKNEPHRMYWGALGEPEREAREACSGDDPTFTDADGDGCSAYRAAADPASVCGTSGYEESCIQCCDTCAETTPCLAKFGKPKSAANRVRLTRGRTMSTCSVPPQPSSTLYPPRA